MKILKIEPTPSPNTLKIILDYQRDDNKSRTYHTADSSNPEFINELLGIEGIRSVFHVMDFISVDKAPKANWEQLLPEIKHIFDDEVTADPELQIDTGEHTVELLSFKGIPYQVKVTNVEGEKRKQLDLRFIDAMLDAQQDDDNVVFLRKWVPFGTRYGQMDEIIQSVIEEVDALFPDSRLNQLTAAAKETTYVIKEKELARTAVEEYLAEPDFQERYRMLDHFPEPDLTDIPFLEVVMQDDKPQLRRLGIVFLGMIGGSEVLPLLHAAMTDKNLTIRRTAGDTLSDLGFKESLPVMHEALDDTQPIVRWRAAMFIYDEGDESSLPYLEKHLDDPAFEVRLQARMAKERITKGEEAVGSVWKQIANREREQ
ncbi:conserved virulence factor C family protein [Macrococcus equipercicus]|uniref:Conserved virulence factor C n=1 Tax=Macrococcus equipercicus TaxID=69967 RepID=A0A9Q9F0I2_9STAP|nr:virulence factor [Macrococcus equipercicus]KAA1040221.1 virulence factor [Macrococcus equipercicus]UTH12835.1 virulence factor [Macrococcus equipercicus]